MKKVIFAVFALLMITVMISSCSSSRKSGCPMNEKIIH